MSNFNSNSMHKNKMKYLNFYKVHKECVEKSTLPCIENILVAHHRQIELSKMDLEHTYNEVSIIAKQHDLNISFLKETTLTHEKLLVQYDVLDLMYALTLLERSVIQN